ncbi:MAG: methylase [Sulfurimonas sp. RIFOXYD12_FULL_36_11]|uniref:class I SAM-dependent DNA methyltransferase n=1 Tax=unclassified Sulfurimonas TaxID=2623549 RepID=UPI0008D26E6F|nr:MULTISPECIES: DNA methyltransferase [unclassified Sulfurimonas]MBS4068635.1 class I SAM-dependent DNA methyltransferase [Sulfurimonas sp.]MDD3855588.1 N-6 DNA methylase [Sulfurimonas sp.]OHE05776.1 MAG: methylase [Sulfurimonas sp. RIFOXYB12_FULL_35_9]OHE18507.1 MAG: methylase [Sulfurimonas sp. RIFOXYD12_FULL_36_11]
MISLKEIRERSIKFTKEWEGASNEKQEAQSFWIDFFKIFDVSPRSMQFEYPIKKIDGSQGYIDVFWRGQLLIEQKSKGKDLVKAKEQALEYLPNLKQRDLPKFILVCDFVSFYLYDLDTNQDYKFLLHDLPKNIELFSFIAGYTKKTYKEEEPTNRKAAELMGKLHDKLLENGYSGHQLELFLTRLLFCMFAEDTGIFAKNSFREFIENQTDESGRDLGSQINYIFELFDTPNEKRQKNLDESFTQFPYINGSIFTEQLKTAHFDRSMREMLLDACAFDWSLISPSIFGSMFQASMDVSKRGELGAHFTSETNILKAIKPLFLDELWEEFGRIKNNQKQLQIFHAKISNLKFLDPACGSGNFLVIAYRELKLVEFEVLKSLKILTQLVHIDQFYGFEIEELPSRITQTAMLLIDHQMNLLFAQMFGEPHFNIPIKDSANIFNVNALRVDWEETLSLRGTKQSIDFIIGNPPFLGSKMQSKEQKEDMAEVFSGVKNGKELDFVTAWYIKSAKYLQGKKTKVALVSTNSITQGEQVGILWQEMFNKYKIKIHFAHKTFKWNNDAKGVAQVYCVIIGFAGFDIKAKRLFEYESVKSEPHEIEVSNINPYLVNGDDFFIISRRKHIQNFIPQIVFGSMPNDGGNLLFTDEEKSEFLNLEPKAELYMKPLISAKEYLNGKTRWCLWLKDCSPNELKSMPKVLERVENIKKLRSESSREATKKLAKFPALFGEDRQPESDYILIPLHSSENREYIPIGFFNKDVIANNSTGVVPHATLFHFGILTSKMHMDWVRYVAGRLKSDYRYSNEIVYNNFPFPSEISDKQKEQIETIAQNILTIRTEFEGASLADLYNPLTMPPKLLKAHETLDKAVDKLYSKTGFKTDTERVAHLFELNKKLTSLIVEDKPKKRGKK